MTPAERALHQAIAAQRRLLDHHQAREAELEAALAASRALPAYVRRQMLEHAHRALVHGGDEFGQRLAASALIALVLKHVPAPGPVAVPSPVEQQAGGQRVS